MKILYLNGPTRSAHPQILSLAQMSLENQRIGRQGEKQFSLLCTNAGVTCNKSIEDDYGWDMLVEFPPAVEPKRPIDLRPVQLTASVQVKATRTRSHSCRISLQNALRMAESPIPSFVFLAVMKDGKPPRYFVVHVWETLIREWLKAAREADAQGVTAIHKESVTIRFNSSDEQTDDPLTWIESQILSVGPHYAQKKLELANTVGFESGFGVANVSLELDSPRDFIDFQLGLKPNLKATRVQFHSVRFGIRAAQPEFDLTDVELTIEPEGVPSNLRFTFPDGQCRTVSSLLYHAIGDHTDVDINAWRIKSHCFDIVRSKHNFSAKASIKFDEVLPFDDLAVFATIQSIPPNEPIKLDLEVGDQEIPTVTITLGEEPSLFNWPGMALALDVMRDIANHAAKPAPNLSIAEIDRAAFELSVLSALACERTMLLKFTPNADAPRKFKWQLAYAVATVGEMRFAAIGRRPIASDRRYGGRRHIYFGPGKLLGSFVGSAGSVSEESVQAAYQVQLDRLADDGEIMALGDLRPYAKGSQKDRDITSDLPSSRSLPKD